MREAFEVHNEMAGKIVTSIVKPTMDVRGDFLDTLILLESVIAGVIVVGVKDGGDEPVLDLLFKNLKERLPKMRAKRAEMRAERAKAKGDPA